MSDNTQNFSFHIEGMTCATCSKMAEKALGRVPGVTYASVNLATEVAFVTADESVTEQALFQAIEAIGFKAKKNIDTNIEEKKHKRAKLNLILCLAVGIPFSCLMYLSEFAKITIPYYSYIEFFAATFCLFYCGRDTFKSALIALRHFHTNMNTLIVISGLAAWCTCFLPLVAPSYNFHSFGASAVMVMMFNLLGRFIESNLRAKATRDLKNLLSLAPKTARIVSDEGIETVVPVEAVKLGATICVRAGEIVSLDGTITQGTSEFDESLITGESNPVTKSQGDSITGGSVNLTGEVCYTVTKESNETFLAQMTHLVEVAQGSKIPLQEMADKLTLVFVPFVLVVAISAFCLWKFFPATRQIATLYTGLFGLAPATGTALEVAVFAFIATLVIACPCALGLATPMAFITASGVATKAGLLIKNIASLQTARHARYCVFDKTGTLTEGKPYVISSVIENQDMPLAFAMEKTSNHPTARAICDYLSTKNVWSMQLSDTHEVAGQGIYAEYNGDKFFLGSEMAGEMPQNILNFKNLYKNCTLSFLYKNETCIATFATIDTIRSDATKAIRQIKELGLVPILATGDKQEVATFVAQKTGIARVFAKQSPMDKLSLIQDLHGGKNDLVIMAGDGINDAPALKGADCSIAMGSGSQISQEASDLVILRGGITNIAYFIRLANFTTKIIYENLFAALAYNVLAIPLAACAALHPAVAEIAMAASGITVVANSLRILRLKH